ncbi:MAG: outer membrane beta-barrel protein [Aestuariivirgaceae bacterium]|nr:outer membrane beta-barrel protein [Aestuariivirgaceae bacterium]
MMKNFRMPNFKSLVLAGVAAMFVSGSAMAADMNDYTPPPSEGGWYLRGDLGWSWLNWDGGQDDGAMTGGGGLGYDYGNGVRADMRVDLTGKYDTGSNAVPQNFGTTTALANAYYDFGTSDIASPYVGAGLGWGWAGSDKIGDDDGFTWAVMAGLNLRLSDSVVADVGYRYRDIMVSGDDLTDHSILAGLRFSF